MRVLVLTSLFVSAMVTFPFAFKDVWWMMWGYYFLLTFLGSMFVLIVIYESSYHAGKYKNDRMKRPYGDIYKDVYKDVEK